MFERRAQQFRPLAAPDVLALVPDHDAVLRARRRVPRKVRRSQWLPVVCLQGVCGASCLHARGCVWPTWRVWPERRSPQSEPRL